MRTPARLNLEAQLRQAQKMEVVGRLAGGVAHDFNNLLTVITGRCNLLLRGINVSTELSRELEEVKKAGERTAALTARSAGQSHHPLLIRPPAPRPRAIRPLCCSQSGGRGGTSS